MAKIKGTFGTFKNEKTGEVVIQVESIAKELAKGWGDIPKHFSDSRAMEIHCLGRAYLKLLEKLRAKPKKKATRHEKKR